MKYVIIISSYSKSTEKPFQNFRKVSNFVFLQISAKGQSELISKETGDDLLNEVVRNQKRKGILVSRASQRYCSNIDKNKNSVSQAVIEKSLSGSTRTESSSKVHFEATTGSFI